MLHGEVLDTRTFDTPAGKVQVYLPADLAAGDTLSGTVSASPAGASPAQQAKNTGTLQGYVVEVGGDRQPVSGGRFETKVASGLPLVVTLLDPKGKKVGASTVNVAPPRTVIVPDPPPPGLFELPTLGQTGRPNAVQGPFDGRSATTVIEIGGQPVRILAESPGQAVFECPTDLVGPATITVREQGTEMSGTFTNVGIELAAARTSLVRGESEAVVAKVTGLQGLPPDVFPLAYHMENLAPEVVSFSGLQGNLLTGSIEHAAVGPDGTFQFQQPLRAVRAGSYNITASVGGPGWPPPPLSKDCLTVLAALEAWKADDIDTRDQASAAARAAFDRERQRLRDQVNSELGPLAFAVFALGVEPEGVIRTRELEDESCIFQALRQAAQSSDAEVGSRAQDILRGNQDQ